MIQNIKVEMIYIPTGIPIPWETAAVDETKQVNVITRKQPHEVVLESEDDDESFDMLFYELYVDDPPPKSTVELNGAMGQVLILEKDGDGAMMVPLTMVVAIGKKGNILHGPVSVKKGFPPNNRRH